MTCKCRSGECDPECDGPKLRAEIERLKAENVNMLKAVLYHFGPEGANKVCTSVLEARAALEHKP